MKAIIPVAGAGIRLRPHTYTQPKPLIPVAGKPIISFIIDQLVDAGVSEFIFVIGYLGEKIKSYLETHHSDLSIQYVVQETRRGLGDAILYAKDMVKADEELVILLGDTIVQLDMADFLRQPTSVLAIHKVEDPRLFGVVMQDESGKIMGAIEKPSIPKSNQAIVGLYKILEVKQLMETLTELRQHLSNEAELHLTDAIDRMAKQGVHFQTYEVQHWYDCGKKDILLESNRVLLKKETSDVSTSYIYENTIIIPPVVYGTHCHFKNCVIGPYVTLGDNVKINNCILEDSIVGNYVELDNIVLERSIVGNDAAIRGKSHSLNVGDNNEIDFTQ